MKERVTLTIERDLLHTVDERVDGAHVKNRSHAVELLLRQSLRTQSPDTAVILAGGRGENLKPLTDSTPKSMVKVDGKPLLQYNIELCRRYGIRNITLCVGHLADQIKEYFGDGSQFGVRITYVTDDRPSGTAGPLRQLAGKISETFIVMNGDELKDINLYRMHRAHVESDARATIALTTTEDTSKYGVAMVDGTRITRFVEKPSKEDSPSRLINAGCYVLEPDVLPLIPEGFAMMETDLFPKLAKDGHLHGYPFSGQWYDITDHERLTQVAQEWKGFS
jgi:NDP-sugar pyrophosphorylase family protein